MLKDLQNERDIRNIRIDKIGINNFRLPFIFDNFNNKYPTTGEFKCFTVLDENNRGAHLSRIIECLNNEFYNKNISINNFYTILKRLKKICASNEMLLSCEFDIFLNDVTPVSKKKVYKQVHIFIEFSNNKNEVSVSLVGTMLCPCSKEISNYGAHSQNALATVTLYNVVDEIDVVDVVNDIESCFSSKVFSILKREDEKYVTEFAYDNSKFSEDFVRDVLLKFKNKYSNKIKAEIENYETIHSHNVYACGEINDEKI